MTVGEARARRVSVLDLSAMNLSGWRGGLAAFLAGGVSILAMAPVFAWPVLWLTLPALVLLVERARAAPQPARVRFARWRRSALGRAAEAGWWFGFGYHVFGLFWIVEAFLVEAETFAWLIPLTLALPAGLALFTAAATGLASALARDRISLVLALALTLGAAEWLRGHILTGLPWNVLGYALTPPGMMQGAAYVGIYGLTVVAVLVFAGAPLFWAAGRRLEAVTLAALPLATLAILSQQAARAYDARAAGTNAESPAPRVRIVQPSIVQREKWRPENQRRIFDAHLELSLTNPAGATDGAEGVALIVWPEAAMPFVPLSQPVALEDIGRILPQGVTLLAGAIRLEPATAMTPRQVYNTLLGFTRGQPARHVSTYDKTHLVPFGEYLPLQPALEALGLRQLTMHLPGGFASGPEPRPLVDVPGVGRLAPLICYEAIFPATVIQGTERPRAMVMVTNDGWFGNTTGPRQHFHMARVRAVEEGVPAIRSANNGISGVIDAVGRVVARLDLDVRGTVDASIPKVASGRTWYSRFSDAPFAVLLACLVAALGWMRLRRGA